MISNKTRRAGPLGVGFVGSGFNARFHMQAFQAVRDAEVRGVWSPNLDHASAAAALARSLDIGEAKAHASIRDMVADPLIEALWLTGPNHMRLENMEEIVNALEGGVGTLRGIACEKPLARNVAEAKRMVALIQRAGVAHGYLENQLFAPRPAAPGFGRAARPVRAGRILRALPRSTVGLMRLGSGAGSCRGAACSTT
jgi:predicted dehydrogenase